MKKLFLLILICFLPAYAQDKEPVMISRVYDGDTIEVINQNNQKENIRLKDIDCFETTNNNRAYKQAYENNLKIEEVIAKGIKSKIVLINLLKNNYDKQMYLVRYGKDKYNRTIGEIFLKDINVNQYMIKFGNAMKYFYIQE